MRTLTSGKAAQCQSASQDSVVDASKASLGSVFLQNEAPVVYASKAMTEVQQCYAQTEKEMLVIVFGPEHVHQFVPGKDVGVESDHKSLGAVLKKPLNGAPPRVQRLLLRCRSTGSLKYKPGKDVYIADTLSHADLSITEDEDIEMEA
ncbi:hypothetical protein scyTo_0000890 [Scyliorhinus torazame]|uniref:Reverse transcriptase RNase H-like domain-containing protein n=1 Tax=Scyliorhinus torazame TaxID=75743 RepID=A0A401P5X4_SCYTO|nr:hypothetical protein [Scyliorhinus torazame]